MERSYGDVPDRVATWVFVECLLQSDVRNVMVAVDLENCFNAIDRDALVDELRRHPQLRALCRYVVVAYPPGMVSTKTADEILPTAVRHWRRPRSEI